MIAVVIPAYKASATIATVVAKIGPEIGLIVVVDDCCPEFSGNVLTAQTSDDRVVVASHEANQGVGGAFLTGMKVAIARGADIIVKIDADDQMNPTLIPDLVWMIENGRADYVKGNRFFYFSDAVTMPFTRRAGNLCLSFLTKASSGYWNVMDPTNGFIAIHADVAKLLKIHKISKRFFFESDMLFHLGLMQAKISDFPMQAVYGDEISNLRISKVMGPFIAGHLRNAIKRIIYRYFLRDFSIASIEVVVGSALFLFGFCYGMFHWLSGILTGHETQVGTIMVSALTLLIGFQLVLAFLNYDISSVPKEPIHPFLRRKNAVLSSSEE